MISKIVSILFTLWKCLLAPEILSVIAFFLVASFIEGISIMRREVWARMTLIYSAITVDLFIHGVYFEDKISDTGLTVVSIIFMISFVLTSVFLVCLIRAIRKKI